ncbi:MAG: hypothetical protein AB8G17_03020 [Gammaproteobacteria bacterium]
MIVIGAIAAPLILFAALQARAPAVADDALQKYRNILPSGAVLMGEHAIRVGAAALSVSLYQTRASGASWHLNLSAASNRQTAGPDVLLYWQRGAEADALAADSVLLGPLLAQRDSVLPLAIPELTGQLVFYSLAHQNVLESIDLTTLNKE